MDKEEGRETPKRLIFQCRVFGDDPVAERPAAASSFAPDRPSSIVRPQPKNKESATAASRRRQRVALLKIRRGARALGINGVRAAALAIGLLAKATA
jgi:hypothetical protein